MVSVAPVSQPQTWHLNLKWSIADTDAIRNMAQSGRTAYGIALWFTRQGKPVSTDEILRLCDEMGVNVRRAN